MYKHSKASRPILWRTEPQHHPCRGYILCLLSQPWPRGKTSRCLRATLCFILGKKICLNYPDPKSCELSQASVHTSPWKSTVLQNLYTQFLPCPRPEEELLKTRGRDGMIHSGLRGGPFWEALLKSGLSPHCLHRSFLMKSPPLLFLCALRGQRVNIITLPYFTDTLYTWLFYSLKVSQTHTGLLCDRQGNWGPMKKVTCLRLTGWWHEGKSEPVSPQPLCTAVSKGCLFPINRPWNSL